MAAYGINSANRTSFRNTDLSIFAVALCIHETQKFADGRFHRCQNIFTAISRHLRESDFMADVTQQVGNQFLILPRRELVNFFRLFLEPPNMSSLILMTAGLATRAMLGLSSAEALFKS